MILKKAILAVDYRPMRNIYGALLRKIFDVEEYTDVPDADVVESSPAEIMLIGMFISQFNIEKIYQLAERCDFPIVVFDETRENLKNDFPNLILESRVSLEQSFLRNITSLVTAHKKRSQIKKPTHSKIRLQNGKLRFSAVFKKKVENSMNEIENSFASIKTIKELSEKHDINNVSMNEAIKQKTGMTAAQYLKEIRLRKVLQLVQFTQLPITEIAVETGYKDIQNLREQFAKKHGISFEECCVKYRD